LTAHSERVAAARELSRWLRWRFGEAIEDVCLYGSVARGTDRAASDIDLLILMTRPLGHEEREELSARAYEIDLEHGTVTQCLVRTLAEWTRPEVQCGGLAREVSREGITV